MSFHTFLIAHIKIIAEFINFFKNANYSVTKETRINQLRHFYDGLKNSKMFQVGSQNVNIEICEPLSFHVENRLKQKFWRNITE